MKARLILGDCLEKMQDIESGSVDLILTDLPYGTMKNAPSTWDKEKTSWDTTLDFKLLFEQFERVLRKNGKAVLFAQQPFTTQLITNTPVNLPFSYLATWVKDTFANALGCNKGMVNSTEDILVFSKKHDTEGLHPLRNYFKQVLDFMRLNLKGINNKLGHRRAEHTFYVNSTQYGLCTESTYQELIDTFSIDEMEGFKTFEELNKIDSTFKSTFNLWQGKKFKSNILEYKKDYTGHHPTQKPVLLLEDLIKTFSNEGDLILDATMGSGSTGVACVNTDRNFIGIELDEAYFNIASERVLVC